MKLIYNALGVALLLLTACSSRQVITEKDVYQAVQQKSEEQLICNEFALALDDNNDSFYQADLGDDIVKIKTQSIDGEKINQMAKKQMQSLVKAGFYDPLASEEIKLQDNIASRYESWRLNAEGSKHFHHHALCVGHLQYSRWYYHSQPAWQKGRFISQVVYAVKPQLDQWAKDFLRIANQRELQRLSLEQLKQSDFYLSSSGWKIL